MQVVLIYLQPLQRNSLLKCFASHNREKFAKTHYFGGSGSFRVTDVDISKKSLSPVLVII